MDASSAPRTLPSTHRPLLLAILLGGFALRLFRLGAESLWYDEAVSVWLAEKSTRAMIAHTAGDIHPPGYYLLLHWWQLAAHPTPAHGLEFLFAWVSVLAGMLILVLLWAVGKRLVGEAAALAGVAVAAIHPFHIWYAQEVRMYTVGGALAMLALYLTLRWIDEGRLRWLALYIVAAAAGLYTLYYFAFAIIGIGVAILFLRPTIRRYGGWLGAQLGVALLLAPWLPVLWRQAVDPPVPAWRAAWTSAGEVMAALSEALAGLLIGQTPLGPLWIWAALALLTVLVVVALARPRRGVLALVAFIFVPITLLFAVSIWWQPLYHVRYLFPIAAPFALVIGAMLVAIGTRSHVAGWVAAGALVALYALSLRAFWQDPHYRSDDHRSAVRELAAAWRPGDAILLNAGWITPLLEIYWPQAGDGAAAVPPPLAEPLRLVDVANGASLLQSDDQVPVVRGGSVGGAPSLGWGDPASDFFALSPQETAAGLERLKSGFTRIWHYRLYDTVSDPEGVTRAWLDANTTTVREVAIPGRDYGRLELHEYARPELVSSSAFAPASFGDSVELIDAVVPTHAAAGHVLYPQFKWEGVQADLQSVSTSLRLYDGNGKLVAQSDAALERVAAVGAPPWLPPGPYSLELVVYRQADGEALPLQDARSPDGQRLMLVSVIVGEAGGTVIP